MSKIRILFEELFRTICLFDPKIHKEYYKEVYKFWDLLKHFVNDKTCFNEIISYGFLDLLKSYVSLVSSESFLDNPNLHIPLETSTNDTNFSSSYKSSKLSSALMEKNSQKLSLLSLVLHSLDAYLEFEANFKKNHELEKDEKKNLTNNNILGTFIEKVPDKSFEKNTNEKLTGESLGVNNNNIEKNNKTMEAKAEQLIERTHNNLKEPELQPKDHGIISLNNLGQDEKSYKDSILENSGLDANNIYTKLIYAPKEKKGFSDYINFNSHLASANNIIIYICFDSLYEIIDILIKKLVPLTTKDSVICFCNIAEVVRYMSKLVSVIKDIDFEPITIIFQSLANACIYKYLENYLENYPVFDFIIESCFLIHERFKFSVEKQIGSIFETLLKEKAFFKDAVLKKTIFLYFLHTLSRLNFKKIGWDLKNTIADLIYILVMSLSKYTDSFYAYYFLVISKQIILHYDIKNFPSIFDSLSELLKYMFVFLKDFNEKIKKIDNNDFESPQEIDKHVLVFCYENLLLLIYFQEFHNQLISLGFIDISLQIGSYILFLNSLGDQVINNTKNIFKYKEDEIFNILKLIVMVINHTTYYMIFHEHIATEENLAFLLDLLMSNIKQLQLISFNSVINLIEANGLNLVKKVMEISLGKIEEINKLLILKKNEKKVNLEPFLSILEHIYFSKDLFYAANNEDDSREIKNFIGFLVTNVIIEKHELKLSKKILDIVLKEAYLSLEIEARFLMILLKIIYFSEGLLIDLRDNILEFFRNSFKQKQDLLKRNPGFIHNLALISIPTIKKFVNSDIRTFKDAISLENVFFWEYCSDQHS